MSALLDVRDLEVTLLGARGPVPVVRGVSLSLAPASTLALVGESGSGKSMTALACLGLTPRARVDGSIVIDGVDVLAADGRGAERIRGSRAGMVFQDPQSALHPATRVGAAVAAVVQHHRRCTRREAEQRSRELLAETGMDDVPRRMLAFPHELSGGLRQRVAIALALAADPKLLIADEPTTALDVTVQAKVLLLLRQLCERRGLGLLLISHDLGVVAAAADRVAVMYAGRVVEEGPVDAVLQAPRHPYTAALRAAVPRVAAPARTAPGFIPGQPPLAGALPPGCPFHPRCDRALAACSQAEPALTEHQPGRLAACTVPERAP